MTDYNHELLVSIPHKNTTQCWHIYYTNYKGESAYRNVVPVAIHFGCTEYHPTEGFLLEAYDVNKIHALRMFAINDMRYICTRSIVEASAHRELPIEP